MRINIQAFTMIRWITVFITGLNAGLATIFICLPSLAVQLEGGLTLQKEALPPVIRLGDGQISSSSYQATALIQQQTQGNVAPTWHYRFKSKEGSLQLSISQVQGLDTKQAHLAGQSQANTFSSPLEIWINGRPAASVSQNGQALRLLLPRTLLNAKDQWNELQIKAGQRVEGRLDYDDCAIYGLQLTWQASD